MAPRIDLASHPAIQPSSAQFSAEPIWALLGRQVVGELTVDSTSVRDVVVLRLGQSFVEKRDEAGTREEARPVLIRRELLATYLRQQVGGTNRRGTMKTRGCLSEAERMGRVARQGGGSPSARFMTSASRVVPPSLESCGAEQALPRPRRTRGGNVLVRLRAVWGFARRGTLTSGAPEYG